MRVAFLNMSDPNQQCPDNWREVQSPIRSCRRQSGSTSDSVFFSTHSISYTQICGRIIAYQYGRPEAFRLYNKQPSTTTIDSNYVDGVSITYGNERKHIWTFAGESHEAAIGLSVCPCSNSNQDIEIPPWVGQDYYCETAVTTSPQDGVFHFSDPLWDGLGCGSGSTCCSLNNPPYFCKQLPEATHDDIEVRIMADDTSATKLENEDTPIQFIELYVQ